MDKKKEFLVALHTLDRDQVLYEAKKILTPDGAHGVILVNNKGNLQSIDSHPNIFSVAVELKETYPNYLIGTNSLDLESADAMTYIPGVLDILWTDIGGIVEIDDKAILDPDIERWLPQIRPKYYGSQLFKYQPKAKNPEAVVKEAVKHFSALITSGTATGSEPNVEKIQQIREWIGPDAKLGIASGMSVGNIEQFLPYADIFIVASSLNMHLGNGDHFFQYDPVKVKTFRAKIDEYEKSNI